MSNSEPPVLEQSPSSQEQSNQSLPAEQDQTSLVPLSDPFASIAPRSPRSVQQDLEWSSWLRTETDSALDSGDDDRASDLLYQQQHEAFRSLVEMSLEGQDPFVSTTPRAAFVHPDIEARRRSAALMRREMEIDRALSESQWQAIDEFKTKTIEAWHARNEKPLLRYKEGMSPEEMAELAEQVRPMELNPDEVANYHQILAQANAALRKIDPQLNVFNHPKTAEAAMWLRQGGQGSFVTPESKRPFDYKQGYDEYIPGWAAEIVGRAKVVGNEFVGAMAYLPWQLVEGTSALAYTAISNIVGDVPALGIYSGADYWNIPTQALVDNTGEVVHNGGKVHPDIALQLNIWDRVLYTELERDYIEDTHAWEKSQREGMQWLISGVAHLGGSLIGFAPAAKAWQWGSQAAQAGVATGTKIAPNLMKGLARVGGSGERASKIRGILVNTTGAAVAGGMVDMLAYGKHEGLAKSFTHGMISTPLYLALGALGRKVEGKLPAKMPERMKRSIGGAAEGFGLGMLENHQLTPLWNFIKDPSEDNWNTYAATLVKNVLGMALFKGAGRGPGGLFKTPETLGRDLGLVSDLEGALRSVAREAATTKDPARREELVQMAEKEGFAREDFLELGRLGEQESVSRGTSPEGAREAREAGDAKQVEMTRKKLKIDRPDAEREAEAWEAKKAQGTGEVVETREQQLERLAREAGDEVVEKVKTAEEQAPELEALRKADEATAVEGEEGPALSASERSAQIKAKIAALKGEKVPERPAEPEGDDEGRVFQERLGEAEARPLSNRDFPAAGGAEHLEGEPGVQAPKVTDFDLVMQGRAPRKGFNLFGWKIGAREGDPVRVPMRVGGFNQKGIRGYMETRQDIIRSAEALDLNNKAHEWSHGMQKKMIGLSKDDLKKVFSPRALGEMVEIGKAMWGPKDNQSRRLAEGFAEFFSRDLLGDANLQRDYPALYNEAMSWMSNPLRRPLAEQYGRIKDLYTRWRLSGAVERGIGTILPEPGSKKPTQAERDAAPGAREKVEAFFADLLDDTAKFHRAYKSFMQAAGKDPSKVPIQYRPGDLQDALRMTAPRIAEGWMKLGVSNLSGDLLKGTKSFDSIMKKIEPEELDHFWVYMKRRGELEMMDAGIENVGVTRQEAQFVVDKLDNPKFERAARDITQWFHSIIDYVAEAGGLGAEQAEVIKGAYTVYMPFHRVAPFETPARKGKTPIAGQGSGIKSRKGSDLPILDPMVAIQKMAVTLAVRAQKAQIMRSMFDHMQLNDGQGGFVTDVSRRYLAKDVPVEQVLRALETAELPGDLKHEMETAVDVVRQLADGNLDALTVFSMQTTPTGKKPIVPLVVNHTPEQLRTLIASRREALENEGLRGEELMRQLSDFTSRITEAQGKLKFLEVDMDAYTLLAGVEGGTKMLDSMPQWVQVIGKAATLPAKTVRLFATTVSLPFVLKNLSRDITSQPLFTKNPSYIPLAGAVAAWKGLRTESEVKGWLNRMGGAGITFVGGAVTGPKIGKDMSRISAESGGFGSQVRNMVKRWADTLGETEQWLRRKEATDVEKQVLERGGAQLEARLEALLAAKEVTVNFTRSSAPLRALNSVFPYFNPGAQGTRKWVRRALGYEGSQKQFYINGITNLTAVSALAYWLSGDEEWYQDLPTWRRTNYWSFKFGDDVLHFSKPFELGVFFTAPFEMMVDAAYRDKDEKSKITLKDFAFELSKGFLNNHQFLPAFALPATENLMNYSMFRGRSIVPEWMERSRMPKDQYDRYTTETAKWLGEAFNYSPAKIENAISGYTAGAGLSLLRALDGFEAAGQKKWPIVSSFISQQHQSGFYQQELYEIDREIEQAHGSNEMSRAQGSFRPRVRQAKERLRAIRKAAESGRLDGRTANRQAYEIAKRIVDSYHKATR